MCIAALGGLAPILSLIGTGVGAVGAIAGAQAQAAAATYKQKQEAMLSEDALKRGAQAEEAQRRKASALAGRQRAVLAASNIDIGSGSALKVQSDTATLSELDANVIQDNAKREANFHQANSDLAGMEASSARTAGVIGAFSTVLGGASSLADKWYKPFSGSSGSGSFAMPGRAAWAGNS
jgi:hypothetical protein